MYYANKQTFYIRQYGPAVIVSVVSLILIASGVFIYLKSTNTFNKQTEVAQTVDTQNSNNTITENSEEPVKNDDILQEESNALVSVPEQPKVEEPKVEEKKEVVKYFENLPTLEKSKEVNVTNVSSSGTVTVETDGDILEVTLIGLDFKYSKDTAVQRIKTDLLNKKVKVAFDNVRSANGVNYAYIYRDNKVSYNAELLKAGLVTLKSERKNTSLNKELASAQAYARDNSLGVWNK